ncbi:MAG: DUF1566 domain-containing protein [Spirochaetia bacterium]|nr:DUF1566 domain-containing protein [Spirochaetia bacterium]
MKQLKKVFQNGLFQTLASAGVMASVILLASFALTADESKNNGNQTGDKRQVSIAIIPFEDKTGSPNYAYLAESIQDAVGAEMGKKFSFKSVDPAKLKEAFSDSDISKRSDLEAIKKSAETLNADFMIFGDYIFNSKTNQIEMTTQLYLPLIKSNRQLKKISNAVDSSLFSATAKVANSVIVEINSMLAATKTTAAKKEITAEALIENDALLKGAGRFVDNNNGTIADNFKRLQWQKCSAGLTGANCDEGTPEWINWTGATNYCQNLKLAGRKWRLPAMEELQSLVRNENVPALDKKVFPNSLPKNYWTSTFYGSGSTTAWYVAFYEGNAGAGSISSIGYFRCVAE